MEQNKITTGETFTSEQIENINHISLTLTDMLCEIAATLVDKDNKNPLNAQSCAISDMQVALLTALSNVYYSAGVDITGDDRENFLIVVGKQLDMLKSEKDIRNKKTN